MKAKLGILLTSIINFVIGISYAIEDLPDIPHGTPPTYYGDYIAMRAQPGKYGTIDLIGKRKGLLGKKPHDIIITGGVYGPVFGSVIHSLPDRVAYDDHVTKVTLKTKSKAPVNISEYIDMKNNVWDIDHMGAVFRVMAFEEAQAKKK